MPAAELRTIAGIPDGLAVGDLACRGKKRWLAVVLVVFQIVEFVA